MNKKVMKKESFRPTEYLKYFITVITTNGNNIIVIQ